MIQQIKSCKQLIPYLKEKIEDEGIEVGIEEKIEWTELAIIKVDDYYAGLNLTITPKIIDFVVVVDCECNAFILYLLELKNVNSPHFLDIKAIHEKFNNTICDFLSEKFADIFLNDRYKYKKVLLYLVSDAYGICGRYKNFDEYKKMREKMNKKDSLKTELSLGSKLFRFRGKILKISYDIPPNPIIQKIL